MSSAIWRNSKIIAYRGKSRTSHYNDIKDGLYVKPVKTGKRSVGTPQNEAEALNAACIAGRSDNETRALVKQLEAARKVSP